MRSEPFPLSCEWATPQIFPGVEFASFRSDSTLAQTGEICGFSSLSDHRPGHRFLSQWRRLQQLGALLCCCCIATIKDFLPVYFPPPQRPVATICLPVHSSCSPYHPSPRTSRRRIPLCYKPSQSVPFLLCIIFISPMTWDRLCSVFPRGQALASSSSPPLSTGVCFSPSWQVYVLLFKF